MALVINKDECIGCGSCASTCPVGAIKEADGKYEIGDECVECRRLRWCLPCRCY